MGLGGIILQNKNRSLYSAVFYFYTLELKQAINLFKSVFLPLGERSALP